MGYSTKSVYLAGPITGLSYGEARHGWREEFAKLLKERAPHIECFSPMRAKEFLSEQQSLECRGDELQKIEHALARPLGILARDGNDVRCRDAVVACFLGAKRVSIGTVWEIGHAKALNKPIIVIMEGPKEFVTEHKSIVERFADHEWGALYDAPSAVSGGRPTLNFARLDAEMTRRGYNRWEYVGSTMECADRTIVATFKVPAKIETVTNPHDHIFITHSSGYVVETLDEAALIAGSLLTPGI